MTIQLGDFITLLDGSQGTVSRLPAARGRHAKRFTLTFHHPTAGCPVSVGFYAHEVKRNHSRPNPTT